MRVKVLLKKVKEYFRRYYPEQKYKDYLKLPIDDNLVLLEGTHGESINGNVFYLLQELSKNKKFKDLKLSLVATKSNIDIFRKTLESHEINNVVLLKYRSKNYYKCLATAKYLINDTTFVTKFIKRDGQKYLNTWHGTPWKFLGRSVLAESHMIGNIQKNLFDSDYLLYPNEFTEKVFLDDYMLRNSRNNSKIVLNGYPRNTVFFDNDNIDKIRKELNVADKQVICYMPTWRGKVSDATNEFNLEVTLKNLTEIDKKIKSNQAFYVNLHPYFKGKIDFSIFTNIKEFPKEYEVYEFLSIADVLVTDYSSVLFDFAITRKKIILFTYDEDEYFKDRGVYFKVDELPFEKVKTVSKLFEAISKDKMYDESSFIEKYCKYDNSMATIDLLEYFILNKKNKLKIHEIPNNNKKNILIFSGNLAKNGITTSLNNLLKELDLSKYNYYITFRLADIKDPDVINNFPKEVNYIPMQGRMNISFIEEIITILYMKFGLFFKTFLKIFKENSSDEIKRLYGDIKFDEVIQFNGYSYKPITLFSLFDCHKTIFVHNNMVEEVKNKKIRRDILNYAYNTYDNLALVTTDLIEPTANIAKKNDNFKIVNNLISYKNILEKGKLELQFDKDTEINISKEKLISILNDKKIKKYINVGRFSVEKGQKRLIDAFDKFYQNHKDTCLIIIGGHGPLYKDIIKYAMSKDSRDNIIIIKSLSNPFPFIKKCDYFVLSSLYEGFGLVLVEADILGLKIVSTDICGPRGFMQDNNGVMVDNSTDGIYNGFGLLYNGKIKKLDIDYEKYNKNAIKNFESLFRE